MKKIGFVYLDGIYLIPHFIGSVAELYKDKDVKVEILVNETENQYLKEILKIYNLPETILTKLPTYLYKKIAYKLQGRKKPSNQYIIKKNLKKILDYDVLVFTVFNNKRIKRKEFNKPKYVFLMHGAGDRPFPFEPEHKPVIEEFVLVTTPGKKINDLFANMGTFNNTQFEICGYQKLDFVKKLNNKTKLFDNDNPTVLYNPHFDKDYTSFYKYGMDILEYFYNNPQYNLVFAPHMILFNKYSRRSLSHDLIPEKYKKAPNMIVDLGSPKLIDMTYTTQSDIYLGDVSSQIYEFLLDKPKPAIFIDIHHLYENRGRFYDYMDLGKVINNIDSLPEILTTANQWHKEYIEKQKQMIAYTFDIDPSKTASKRVAEAIKQIALEK